MLLHAVRNADVRYAITCDVKGGIILRSVCQKNIMYVFKPDCQNSTVLLYDYGGQDIDVLE